MLWRKNGTDVENGQIKWPMGRSVSGPGLVDHGSKSGMIEIVERKSLELRESFEITRLDRTRKDWDRFVM